MITTTNETMDVNTNTHREMSKFEANVWFWSVAGFFTAVWVLLPALVHTGYRDDVIEQLSIAPEWVLSTKKLPNLPSWILEIVNIFTNRSFAAPFIASQLCTLLAVWSVWQLGRTVLEERLALIGAFSILPYSFFSTDSTEYNHNIPLIAFWCLSIYLVRKAFQTNQKRYWVSAGIALGLAFHAKYSAVFLVIAILVYMFARKEGRQYWRTPGPYITTMIAFLVFLPNLIWLFSHDFIPLHYIDRQTGKAQGYQHIIVPLVFAVKQLYYCIPPLMILIPVIGFAWKWKVQHHESGRVRECEKFLFLCFMVPLVSIMLYSVIQGADLRWAYGAAFWVFGGTWLLLRFKTSEKTAQSFGRVVVLTIVVEFVFIAIFLATLFWGIQNPKVSYPMRKLGVTCEQIWRSRVSGDCPCFVSGNNWTLTGISNFMSNRPATIIPQGTWADDDDLNQKGGMIVWERMDETRDIPDDLHRRFPQAEVLSEAPEIPYQVGRKTHVLKIGIAIVPPPGAKSLAPCIN